MHSIEKTIYFVRHGQSEDNVSLVFQSTTSPLSEMGIKQADHIAERVSHLSFETLIASPLERAKQTAGAISSKTGKTVVFEELFVERIKPSSINGKPHSDERANTTWREWEKSLYTSGMHVEDGENFDNLLARADKAIKFLQERTEQSIVVVTHGFFLRTIVARVLLGDALSEEVFKRLQRNTSMENTGMTVLRYQGDFKEDAGWRLWIYNDHAHLG